MKRTCRYATSSAASKSSTWERGAGADEGADEGADKGVDAGAVEGADEDVDEGVDEGADGRPRPLSKPPSLCLVRCVQFDDVSQGRCC